MGNWFRLFIVFLGISSQIVAGMQLGNIRNKFGSINDAVFRFCKARPITTSIKVVKPNPNTHVIFLADSHIDRRLNPAIVREHKESLGGILDDCRLSQQAGVPVYWNIELRKDEINSYIRNMRIFGSDNEKNPITTIGIPIVYALEHGQSHMGFRSFDRRNSEECADILNGKKYGAELLVRKMEEAYTLIRLAKKINWETKSQLRTSVLSYIGTNKSISQSDQLKLVAIPSDIQLLLNIFNQLEDSIERPDKKVIFVHAGGSHVERSLNHLLKYSPNIKMVCEYGDAKNSHSFLNFESQRFDEKELELAKKESFKDENYPSIIEDIREKVAPFLK